VGEQLHERDSGEYRCVVYQQLNHAILELLEADIPTERLQRMVVAYEPVWAIGTGRTATPEQAQEMHATIREQLAGPLRDDASLGDHVRILYGGSVKPENAAKLIAQPDIDGFLVGGASLYAQKFYGIAKIVDGHAKRAK